MRVGTPVNEKPGRVVFQAEGRTIAVIQPDGRVYVNPEVSPREVASGFWDAIQAHRPIVAVANDVMRDDVIDELVTILEKTPDVATAIRTLKKMKTRTDGS